MTRHSRKGYGICCHPTFTHSKFSPFSPYSSTTYLKLYFTARESMIKNSGKNSPKNEKTVGFQDVEEEPSGTDMKLLFFSGQINPVDGKNSVGVASCGPISAADKCSRDCFYEKLDKLHESSGLSFIFNLREAKLDLYLLYKAVTERDGFLEVSKHGKWKEVASLFNLKNQHSMLPCQFQKVYENLLYRYEQTYFYRMPEKASKKEGMSEHAGYPLEDEQGWDCLALKRKYCENRSKDCAEKIQSTTTVSYRESTSVQHVTPQELGSEPLSGFVSPVQKSDVQMTCDEKKAIDNSGFPTKPRTGYQLFLRGECDRLKKIHGESPTGTFNFRDMAVEKWKNLSETDRQPYVEASQKERDIYKREMANDEQLRQYKRRKYRKHLTTTQSVSAPNDDKPALVTMEADVGNPFALFDEMENRESIVANDKQPKQYKNTEHEKKPSVESIYTAKDDDYHVTLEADVGNAAVVPDESLVESTIRVLKNARPTDPIFQTNWGDLSEFPG